MMSDQPVARPLPTHRIHAHTNIHALSGIRTHYPSVRVAWLYSQALGLYLSNYDMTPESLNGLTRKVHCYAMAVNHVSTASKTRSHVSIT
jgi:hypothetical protein